MRSARKILIMAVRTSLVLLLLLCLIIVYYFHDIKPIVFESLESKTMDGRSVYNRIQFIPGKKIDIWLMQQSHHDFNEKYSDWDRLAIKVDKSTSPIKASFYQLTSGELKFEPHSALPFRARCFACHSNGPRAVRPNLNSALQLSLNERLKIQIWNLRIKSYGQIESTAGAEFTSGVPFKATQAVLSAPLKLKSCEPCHSQSGIRNELRMEHLSAATFLIEGGFMPPFPMKISDSDSRYLKMLTGS